MSLIFLVTIHSHLLLCCLTNHSRKVFCLLPVVLNLCNIIILFVHLKLSCWFSEIQDQTDSKVLLPSLKAIVGSNWYNFSTLVHYVIFLIAINEFKCSRNNQSYATVIRFMLSLHLIKWSNSIFVDFKPPSLLQSLPRSKMRFNQSQFL